MSFDHRESESSGAVESHAPSRAPGKSTLTQRLPAIQRSVPDADTADEAEAPEAEASEAADTSGADDIYAIAAGGASGAGAPLPHLATIQAAFGHHDVSGVEAHTDAAASAASQAMGARGYASGNHAVFDGAPDLHTAAHEAAHVVQQRAGVHLKGGVGEVGDPYERHADAVADLVVQGKSAASLLDTMAGGRPSTAPAPSGAIQRKETPQHLAQKQQAARASVVGIGDAVDKKVKDGLAAELATIVTTDRATALTTAAKTAAEAGLAGGSEGENDAKAQVGKLVSGAVAELIKTKTKDVADDVARHVKVEAMAAAHTAIAGARPGKVFDTKTADLVAKAKTAAKEKAAAGAAQRLQAGKTKVAAQAFLQDITTAVQDAGRDRATTELTARTTHDQAVLDLIDEPVKGAHASVHTAIQAYLEGQIGANGTRFFGHTEANAFRKKMKQAAREQAYSDINDIGGTKTLTHHGGQPTPGQTKAQQRLTGSGEAMKNYYVMQGKAQAYDDAKVPVNAYLKSLAHDGTNKLLTTAGTHDAIHGKASTAAWDVLRDKPTSKTTQTAAARAATSAAAAEAGKQQAELLKDGTGAAFQWQDALLKNQTVETQDDTGTDGSLVSGGTTAMSQVQDKVKDEHVGSKALETAIQAETVGEGLSMLGGLIDLAVPNSGEALKLGVELKIPVPQAPGVFCVLKVEGTAERHQGKDLELGVSLEFGAGWETWGLSLDARLFLFLKARGADTDKALKMMSYGVYRDLCSNPAVPEAMATWYATGKAARTGEYSTTEEAETWAAMVEEYAMTGAGGENAFVEAGEGIVGQGKLKAGLVEGQAKLSGQTMRHWDKQTMARAGLTPGQLSHVGNKDERERLAREKRKKASKGERRFQWNFEAQVDFEAAGQKFGAGVKLQRVTGPKQDSRLGWLDFEIIGQLPYDASNPASSTLLSQIAGQWVPNGISAVRQIYDRVANRQDKDTDTKSLGTVVDQGADIFQSLDTAGLTSNVQKGLTGVKIDGANSEYMNETVTDFLGTRPTGDVEKQVSQHAMKSLLQLSIYFKDGNLGFSLAEVKKLDLGIGERAGVGVSATVSSEKTKKLFSAGTDGVNNW